LRKYSKFRLKFQLKNPSVNNTSLNNLRKV
jgi:hypothetical protein